ncbi:MAG: hypothetical protein Ct9H300mP14_02890 [Gammaproteobacteria bacterium]|nr:MAG: hypothetical protein Ct9H300mP14_02890 [Gammaproteobacteria bacterium]
MNTSICYQSHKQGNAGDTLERRMPVTNKSLSLDELVRANKDQFDRILMTRCNRRIFKIIWNRPQRNRCNQESQTLGVSASDSNIVNILNQKFNTTGHTT